MTTEYVGWDPYEALKAMPNVSLEYQEKLEYRGADGMWGLVEKRPDGTWHVTLKHDLSPIEERCVLAHELTHIERGFAFTDYTPDALIDLEEDRVEAEAASRLVPPVDLVGWLHEQWADGVAVSLTDIADRYRVTEAVADQALDVAFAPWNRGYGK